MALGSTNFCDLAGDFRCVKYQYSFSFFRFLFFVLFQEKIRKFNNTKEKGSLLQSIANITIER